jgi:two-component system response regulator YesN
MEPILSTMQSLIREFQKQESKPIRQAIRFMGQLRKAVAPGGRRGPGVLCASYFSNLFKKETGDNFTDYLTNLRIAKAKEFLQQTDMNVAEISFRVGYSDARYFSKLFSKVVGIKPTEYRKIYG